MAILSIQSHVVYGYAGNTAAVFPLQRRGYEVWAVNTVEFSNHTGYGAWKGSILGAQLAQDLVSGLEDRGVLANCTAVLSGYMGDADVGDAVMAALQTVRCYNPEALYCCDPVMGDVGRGFYVKPGIPAIFKEKILPRADIITPNQFELEALTGIDVSTDAGIRQAVDQIHSRGPKVVLVTSFRESDESTGMLVSNGKELYRIQTDKLAFPTVIAGSGDLTAAVFLSHYLESGDIVAAVEHTASSVFSIMKATFDAGSRELRIIHSQQELISPSISFMAAHF
ncbi:pyridoxal kinase PdxY [Spirochaetia bacterium]|nr:pyridoxal kinase PdxY [Spirochaetia bacterium]GHU32870.1 pyridoxal kinase PdxY [Spirochaetia bacterium]